MAKGKGKAPNVASLLKKGQLSPSDANFTPVLNHLLSVLISSPESPDAKSIQSFLTQTFDKLESDASLLSAGNIDALATLCIKHVDQDVPQGVSMLYRLVHCLQGRVSSYIPSIIDCAASHATEFPTNVSELANMVLGAVPDPATVLYSVIVATSSVSVIAWAVQQLMGRWAGLSAAAAARPGPAIEVAASPVSGSLRKPMVLTLDDDADDHPDDAVNAHTDAAVLPGSRAQFSAALARALELDVEGAWEMAGLVPMSLVDPASVTRLTRAMLGAGRPRLLIGLLDAHFQQAMAETRRTVVYPEHPDFESRMARLTAVLADDEVAQYIVPEVVMAALDHAAATPLAAPSSQPLVTLVRTLARDYASFAYYPILRDLKEPGGDVPRAIARLYILAECVGLPTIIPGQLVSATLAQSSADGALALLTLLIAETRRHRQLASTITPEDRAACVAVFEDWAGAVSEALAGDHPVVLRVLLVQTLVAVYGVTPTSDPPSCIGMLRQMIVAPNECDVEAVAVFKNAMRPLLAQHASPASPLAMLVTHVRATIATLDFPSHSTRHAAMAALSVFACRLTEPDLRVLAGVAFAFLGDTTADFARDAAMVFLACALHVPTATKATVCAQLYNDDINVRTRAALALHALWSHVTELTQAYAMITGESHLRRPLEPLELAPCPVQRPEGVTMPVPIAALLEDDALLFPSVHPMVLAVRGWATVIQPHDGALGALPPVIPALVAPLVDLLLDECFSSFSAVTDALLAVTAVDPELALDSLVCQLSGDAADVSSGLSRLTLLFNSLPTVAPLLAFFVSSLIAPLLDRYADIGPQGVAGALSLLGRTVTPLSLLPSAVEPLVAAALDAVADSTPDEAADVVLATVELCATLAAVVDRAPDTVIDGEQDTLWTIVARVVPMASDCHVAATLGAVVDGLAAKLDEQSSPASITAMASVVSAALTTDGPTGLTDAVLRVAARRIKQLEPVLRATSTWAGVLQCLFDFLHATRTLVGAAGSARADAVTAIFALMTANPTTFVLDVAGIAAPLPWTAVLPMDPQTTLFVVLSVLTTPPPRPDGPPLALDQREPWPAMEGRSRGSLVQLMAGMLPGEDGSRVMGLLSAIAPMLDVAEGTADLTGDEPSWASSAIGLAAAALQTGKKAKALPTSGFDNAGHAAVVNFGTYIACRHPGAFAAIAPAVEASARAMNAAMDYAGLYDGTAPDLTDAGADAVLPPHELPEIAPDAEADHVPDARPVVWSFAAMDSLVEGGADPATVGAIVRPVVELLALALDARDPAASAAALFAVSRGLPRLAPALDDAGVGPLLVRALAESEHYLVRRIALGVLSTAMEQCHIVQAAPTKGKGKGKKSADPARPGTPDMVGRVILPIVKRFDAIRSDVHREQLVYLGELAIDMLQSSGFGSPTSFVALLCAAVLPLTDMDFSWLILPVNEAILHGDEETLVNLRATANQMTHLGGLVRGLLVAHGRMAGDCAWTPRG
ncbi:hypothetical protein J8273_5750 [Carpediemonas membranifera]|uniref:Uncharacterized protein n=1 Tax=Carpediemonas membranifera TaxID=201153 RepID=A0A8J6B9L9_9EUKA|nr:hypothetical protein J8273_5750 [Carpediemonas membranifera]|eukprot:KAG9392817.1 hypothetical protein J8273_5750 [Carpediemonas membranifera]